MATLLAVACAGRNSTSPERADASADAAQRIGGFVTSCVGQTCGTRCILDPPNCSFPDNCGVGWCDTTLVPTLDGDVLAGCRAPPEIGCNLPCADDSECPPFVGQDHGPPCNDRSISTGITPKCLQHYCRYVHWPICPEGGDASKYLHYDPNATTCEQLLPQITTLAETIHTCDPSRDAGPQATCMFPVQAPCCWFLVDDGWDATVLDYLGRTSQADDLGCKWKTCSDSTCPGIFLDHSQCETTSDRPVCVAY
jgi:hypothetical protein